MASPPSALERMIYISRATREPAAELDIILALASEFCREVEAMAFTRNDLLRVADLPFSQEVLRYPGISRRLSRSQVEKQQIRSLSRVQQRFVESASRARFHFSWRGVNADWQQAKDGRFSLIAVGRDDSPWQTYRTPAVEPLQLLYDNSTAGQRALTYAASLSRQFHLPLHVLLPDGQAGDSASLSQLRDQLHRQGIECRTIPIPNPDSMAALKTIIAQFTAGILFLPNNTALLTLAELGDFLTAVHIPVILVNPT